MCKTKKARKNLIRAIVNTCLTLLIITILFLKFYKREISCDCSYGSMPAGIVSILANRFPQARQRLKLIMIFNELPRKKDMDMMARVFKKFRSEVDLLAFFQKRFKLENPINYYYRFFPNKKILCKKDNVFLNNYFLLLDDGKVKYVDIIPNSQILSVLLNKNLGRKIDYNVFNREELTEKIKRKILHGSMNLWNVISQNMERLDISSPLIEIHFYHSGCTSCGLRNILEKVQINHISSEKAILNVFSFKTNLSEITDILSDQSQAVMVYYDVDDYFDLGFTMTDNVKSPVIINNDWVKREIDETL